ncbi:MAG: hypothetical protein HDS11_06815 [Bacteroides sp.]|nr:hypothetical protein [Bacteroides sp.]
MTHKIISLIIGAIAVISAFAQASSIPEGRYKALGSPFALVMSGDSCTVIYDSNDDAQPIEVQRAKVTKITDNLYKVMADGDLEQSSLPIIEKKGRSSKKSISVTLKFDNRMPMPLRVKVWADRNAAITRLDGDYSETLDSFDVITNGPTLQLKVPKKTKMLTFSFHPLPPVSTSTFGNSEIACAAVYHGSLCPYSSEFTLYLTDKKDIEVSFPYLVTAFHNLFFTYYIAPYMSNFIQFVDGNIEFNNMVFRKVE